MVRWIARACRGTRTALFALPLLALVAGCGSSRPSNAAAVVNGQTISLASYNTEVKLKVATSTDSNNGLNVCAVKDYATLCKQIKHSALSDLIAAQLVQQYAAAHHISVSPSELQARWAMELQSKFDNKPDVAQAYAERMHVTVADLQQQVKQSILEDKVLAQLTANMSQYTPAVKISRISLLSQQQYAVFEQDLKHMTFAQAMNLFTKNNAACSQQDSCGDLGWTPTTFLVGADREFITAPVGKLITSQAPLMYAVVDHLDARNQHYHMTPVQVISMREAVLNIWLHKQLQRASVHTYVSV